MTWSFQRTAVLARAALAGAVIAVAVAGCAFVPPVPAMSSGRPAAGDPGWAPRAGLRWQIQLSGPVDTAGPANVYDLDPYGTSAQTVATLRARGRQTMCHLDVGVTDPGLPDAGRIPASVIGAAAGGGRRYVDVRAWSTLEPVLTDRLLLCRDKGFQAVDADGTDVAPGASGFRVTAADEELFGRRVADLAHSVGLRVSVRAAPGIAAAIEPYTDFNVVGGCFANHGCAEYFAFIRAGKAVFDVETERQPSFCPLARAYGFAAIRKRTAFDAFVKHC